jgi:hypothetical protein
MSDRTIGPDTMRASELVAALLTILLVGSAVAPASVAASNRQQAYAGTHVSFDASGNAVADYAVDGETMLESVKVQSKSEAGSDGSLGSDLDASLDAGAASEIAGAAVSVDAKTETEARVVTESGATLRAHDNGHGTLVVRSGESAQLVAVNVSESSTVESEGENRVVVTTENGTRGTFVAVGNGSVSATDDGNVSAELGAEGRLVYRSYPEGRDEGDAREERLIADGEATAEVYLTGDASADGESAVDVVRYGENTTVETTARSESEVTMTAERTTHDGTIILTSISNSTVGAAEDLQVSVDGEAVARASTYGDLRSAADGGDTSKFLVRQRSSAEANTEVAIAVNHFSERTITMESTDGSNSTATDGSNSTATDDADSTGDDTASTTDQGGESESTAPSDSEAGGQTDTSVPGFGVGATLAALALAGAIGVVRRRR